MNHTGLLGGLVKCVLEVGDLVVGEVGVGDGELLGLVLLELSLALGLRLDRLEGLLDT